MCQICVESPGNGPCELAAKQLNDAAITIPVAELELPKEGLENHYVGGDISQCPFLNRIGAVGLDRTVTHESAEITPAEGTSLAEILAEKRRQRAEAKASQSEQAQVPQEDKKESNPMHSDVVSQAPPIFEVSPVAVEDQRQRDQLLDSPKVHPKDTVQAVPMQQIDFDKPQPTVPDKPSVIEVPKLQREPLPVVEITEPFSASELPNDVVEKVRPIIIQTQTEVPHVIQPEAPTISFVSEIPVEPIPDTDAANGSEVTLQQDVEVIAAESPVEVAVSAVNSLPQDLKTDVGTAIYEPDQLPLNGGLHTVDGPTSDPGVPETPAVFASPEAATDSELPDTMIQQHIKKVIEQEPEKKAIIVELMQEIVALAYDGADSLDIRTQLCDLLQIDPTRVEGMAVTALMANLLLQDDIDEPVRAVLLSYLNRIGTAEHRHPSLKLKTQNYAKVSNFITQLLRLRLVDAVAA